MKKLLSFIAAGALALGLAGCSGSLHDVTLIDLTGYGVIGSMTGWTNDTDMLVDNGDGTYKVEFTYADGASFALRLGEDWAHAFRWNGVAGAKDEVKFEQKDTVYKVYAGDSANCMSLPCAAAGDKVTINIVPQATYLEMSVSIVVPEPMYVSVDNAVAAMTPTANDGEYLYTVTGDGSDMTFKVFDGTDTYGLAASAYATSATELVKNGAGAIKIATIDGAKYLIYVTKTADGLSVVTSAASYCYKYSIAGFNSNFGNYDITWTADGTSFKATVTIPAGTANGWGGTATSDIEFGVCTAINDWGTKFTGATLEEAGKAYSLTLNAGSNNKITGVNPSEKDVVLTLVSTDDGITVSYAQ